MLHTEGTVSYISVLIEKNVHDLCPYGQKLVLFGVILDSKRESQTVIEKWVTVCRQ